MRPVLGIHLCLAILVAAFSGGASCQPAATTPLAGIIIGEEQIANAGDRVTISAAMTDGASAVPGATYLWTQTGGPPVVLADPSAFTTTFTAPAVGDQPVTLTFEVLVSTDGVEYRKAVNVIVQGSQDGDQSCPVAEAGNFLTVSEGDDVQLDGSRSSSPVDHPLTFQWTQVAGPTVELRDAATVRAVFKASSVDTDTTLTFSLTVSDGVCSATDTVNVTVLNILDPASLEPTPALMIAASPAEGPAPLNVTFTVATVDSQTLPDGTYTWGFGDNTMAEGRNVSHTFASAGTYVVTLCLIVGTGASGPIGCSETTVRVTSPSGGGGGGGAPPVSAPPTVSDQGDSTDAGVAKTLTLQGSDPNNANLTFAIVASPTHGTLGAIDNTPQSTATVLYTPSTGFDGVDSFTFKAHNGSSESGTAVFTITVNAPPGVLAVSPTDAFIVVGNPGGPFSPLTKTYTLSNTGGTTIDWTAAKTQSWVTLDHASGSLSAGATDSVVVSINSDADGLAANVYGDALTFTNTSSGNGNTTRAVSLWVGGFPITGTVTRVIAGGGTAPVAGLGLTFTGSGGSAGQNFTATTAANGTYTAFAPVGWTGTAAATDPDNWRLTPTTRSYTNMQAAQPAQDVTAARNYYIAPAGGSDAGSGLIAAPYATLNKAFQVVKPGDTIYLRGGTYIATVNSGFARLQPTASGTASAHITLKNYIGEHVTIDVGSRIDFRFVYLTGLSYWHISGLEITQFTIPFDITSGAHDVTIEDCEMHDLGIPVTQEGKLRVRDSYSLTFRRCQFHHIAGAGVNIGGACHDILFEDCDSHDNDDGRGTDGDGDGFNVDRGGTSTASTWTTDIVFRRCRAWNVSEDCFDIKADNVVLDRCEARNAGATCYKLWSIASTWTTPAAGMQTRFRVTNCLSYDAGENGIEFQNCPDVTLANNTFVQARPGSTGQGEAALSLPSNPSGSTWLGRLYSRNNMFIHLGTTTGGDSNVRAMQYTLSSWILDMDYDVFMTPNYATYCVIRWTDPTRNPYRYYTPAEIENGTFSATEGIEQHSRAVVPTFVDLAGGNVHLGPADTIARDTGQDVTASGVTDDLDGVSRPQGGGFDRGCYER